MKFGDYEIKVVNDGTYEYTTKRQEEILKAFAPKTSTLKNVKARLLLRANNLLVRTPQSEFVLFDSGFGDSNFLREGIKKISEDNLVNNLKNIGVEPNQISHVIQTHLHYDHAGGLAFKNENSFSLAFPNAKIWFGEEEWRTIFESDETPFGYEKGKLEFVKENAEVEFSEGSVNLFEDFSVEVTRGHTFGHRVIFLKTQGQTLCYLGDILPMSSHINLDSEMNYDIFKEEARIKRKELLERAFEENWFLVFYHSPRVVWGFLKKDGKGKFFLES
ncbi:MAG: MBL fold metallo-hydrolase [Calditrichaeota bacterium]|nr:MAG: MBL fold metallo-hydrolase [Calditrichota bacterium]